MTKDLGNGFCRLQSCNKLFKKRRKAHFFCSSLHRYSFHNEQTDRESQEKTYTEPFDIDQVRR
jgi:hypothetical protein